MSTPAQQGGAPPSFAANLARTLAFMLICGIVGPLFIFFYFAFGRELGTEWMLWSGLGVTAMDVGIAVAIAASRTRSQQRTWRLRNTGRRGYAEVLAAEQTGVRINDQPLYKFHVRIHGDDMAPFEAQRRIVVTYLHLPLIGGPLPVLVDPETLEWEIDWDGARPASYRPQVQQESAADRLAELDDLLKRDLIGPDEYAEQRRRIIDGI